MPVRGLQLRLLRVTLSGYQIRILLGLLGLGFSILELGLERVPLAYRKRRILLGLLGLGFSILELGLERVPLACRKCRLLLALLCLGFGIFQLGLERVPLACGKRRITWRKLGAVALLPLFGLKGFGPGVSRVSDSPLGAGRLFCFAPFHVRTQPLNPGNDEQSSQSRNDR